MMNSDHGNAPIRMSLHDSIHMIHREDWMHVAADASPYLRYDHLLALEDGMAGTMDFRYAIYYCEENHPIGIAYFQVVDLEDRGSPYQAAAKKLGKGIGSRIIKEMRVRCLVNGNAFHCGDHGSFFKVGVSTGHRLRAVSDTMTRLDKGCYFKPMASILIVKDLWPEQYDAGAELETTHYSPLMTEPNMVMDLDPVWTGLDQYMEALNAKSRTRLRAVQKRSVKVGIRSLTASEVGSYEPEMQALFEQVLERSPFTFGRLDVRVYTAWKKIWGEKLVVRGFFLDGRLMGFTTAFVLNKVLDVQFVGMDYAVNQEHGIYQRMLLDVLELALERNLEKVIFGRTAEQAKSNLGAVPVDMRFYVKHRNALANKLVGPFLRKVRPPAFEQRYPFRSVLA